MSTKAKADREIPEIEFASIHDFPNYDPYHVAVPPFDFPPEVAEGFYRLPYERYDGIALPSYSFYKAMSQSPAHGLAYLRQEARPVSSLRQKSFDFGTALHWLMLEPELFEKRVVIDCGFNKNSNDWKAWRETVPAECVILSAFEVEDAMRMRDRAMRKDTIRHLLAEPGLCEVSGVFQDPEFGRFPLWHKIRIDKLLDGIVIDYKTTANASRMGFAKTCYQYKYFWQAAHYLQGATKISGFPHQKFVWIVQEKEDPWEARVIVADPQEVSNAENELAVQKSVLAECIKTGCWPGYNDAGLDEVFPFDLDNPIYDEDEPDDINF